MTLLRTIFSGLLITLITGCGTQWKVTVPTRTALDQVLLSTAADRAAKRLTGDYEGNVVEDLDKRLGRCFIETQNFKANDQEYAIHAIRRHFLDAGVILVEDKAQANTIIEIASGGLSIDNTSNLFGIPEMAIPVPVVGTVTIPELSLYKKETNRGLAKFAMSLIDAKTQKLRSKSFFTIGSAEATTWTILLLFDISDNNLDLPEDYKTVGQF